MHAMFPPQQRKPYLADKQKFYKPTINKSIEGFVQEVASAEDIDGKIESLLEEYSKVGDNVQPRIFKNLSFVDGKYSVVFNEYYFAFNDILLAIDCCFKLFFVFNVQYPFESTRFWKFIAHFFYGIAVNDRDVISVAQEFRHILNSK